MALWCWSNLYHHSIASVVDADAATAFEKMAHDCIESLPELMVLDFTEHPARPAKHFIRPLSYRLGGGVEPTVRRRGISPPRAPPYSLLP